ncbi:MAG TPA: protein kinase, partial [Thermoanaerobaculia bacterium]|nr:protein kinase [Thermoanaerobaculia bacterium]
MIAPGSRLGPYEIVAKLGEGGMGQVWKAKDFHLGREVALKVLPEGFTQDRERLARFEREAKLLAQLNHPSIAQIYGLEVSGDTRALVMELVEGPTLAERLESGPLPFNESLSLSLQIARALEEAHEKGIIHRDLKPQNIKASIEGKVKVLDFGLAKAMDPVGSASGGGAGSASQLGQSPTLTAAHGTQLGMILGTAAYMAPEQARGVGVDKRADIWAFGVVLYEMLAGGRLFEGELVTDVLANVLKKEVHLDALPAETPSAIRRLLRRCLERNPKNRLHDIADARIVIEEVLRPGGAEEPAPPVAAPPRGASRRELAAWGVALLASIVAGVLLSGRIGAPAGAPSERLQPLRFSVLAEEQGSVEGYPAFSPDGRTLVYSLVPEEGSTALWAHSFESGKGRRLPGTEGGEQPFWSPDGKVLAFFAAGQLKRLDLATGLVQNLFRVPDPRGGSWTADGDLLLSVNAASPIVRLSPATGESRAVTRLASDKGEQSHRFPWALDGGAFLYTAIGAAQMHGIYWQPGPDAPSRRILPDTSRAIYDERGVLLWSREGTLLAQRFDPARGELSGEMIPLAEQVGADTQKTASDTFGASTTGSVAYFRGAGETSELVWHDRGGKALGVLATRASFREPALSPDGRQVVVSIEGGGTDVLWIYEASGFDRGRRLTFDAAGGETAIWSPDGRWIAYTSARANGYALFRKPADGSGEEELLFESGIGSWIDSWSPDGQRLLFERFVPESGADLWILPLDGRRQATKFLEAPGNECHAAFSPDGRFVAYVSDEGGIQ